VIILLTLALAVFVAAGQEQPASPAASRSSNTRVASAVVRIVVDPAILPLTPETVTSLIHSRGVLDRAGRDILSLGTPEDLDRLHQPRDLIMVRWLHPSAAARLSPQEELMRQMEEVYGRDYAQTMLSANQGMMGVVGGAAPADRPAREGKPEGRSGAYGMSGGGMVGGMGGMGGVAGGAGVGGMAGGGMGRMGGMGGLGFGGALGVARQETVAEPGATIQVQVNLSEGLPPRAEEFLTAVVGNLREHLSQAQEACAANLRRWLDEAGAHRRTAEAALEEADADSPAARQVREQLDTLVDLSVSGPVTLADAIALLRKSVEPPLNVMVLWNDLYTQLRLEPTTPSNIGGLSRVRLKTALDLLVKDMPAGDAKPQWRIRDNVIVIGTAGALGLSPSAGGQPRIENEAVNLAGERSELARRIQVMELDLAGLGARREAILSQMTSIRLQVERKLQQDPVVQELEKLTQITGTFRDSEGRVVPVKTPEGQEQTIRARIELANRREELSQQAGGGQLEEFSKELSRMAVDKAEKEAQLKVLSRQLDGVQKQLAQTLAFDPEAAKLRLAQTAIDIADRRVADLQTRLANLQPPQVTVLGAN
jgi:hypothetical protein